MKKKKLMIFIIYIILMLIFFSSCSNNQSEDNNVHKLDNSLISNDSNRDSDNSSPDRDTSYKVTDEKSWPYELDFKGINSIEEIKTGNLKTNYQFFSNTSCLFCPDIDNDILYYVNYGKDNYIYQLNDGTISLLVEKEAYCLQLWENKLYFLSPNQNFKDTLWKTGDIYCYNIDTKKVELIIEASAFSLFVDSYGIFYQNIVNSNSGFIGYHLDFESTTPQKTEYQFYYTYNEYMLINDFDNLLLCNRITGDKYFLIPILYATNNNLRFGNDYMVFTLDGLVYVLNLRTGKKDIYDVKSMTVTFETPVDYFINDNILYMVNTNRFLALDLSNGELTFPSKYITYDDEIVSKYVYVGKDHYYTLYNINLYTPDNYLINERSLSTGKLTMELNK